jgi:hypothetical protein
LARGARLSWRAGWPNFTWLTLLALQAWNAISTLLASQSRQTRFAFLTWRTRFAFLTRQAWLTITHHRQAFCHLGRELGQSRLNGHVASRLQFQDLDSKFSCGSRELRNSQLALAPEIIFLRRKHVTNDVMPNINRNVARP